MRAHSDNRVEIIECDVRVFLLNVTAELKTLYIITFFFLPYNLIFILKLIMCLYFIVYYWVIGDASFEYRKLQNILRQPSTSTLILKNYI